SLADLEEAVAPDRLEPLLTRPAARVERLVEATDHLELWVGEGLVGHARNLAERALGHTDELFERVVGRVVVRRVDDDDGDVLRADGRRPRLDEPVEPEAVPVRRGEATVLASEGLLEPLRQGLGRPP